MQTVNNKCKALLLSAVIALLSGCGETAEPEYSYQRISMQEACGIMERESGYIILDVRTAEEYAAGHIPNAVNLPNEEIGAAPPELLPDKEQTILVYCRSGNRSKQAAEKLCAMGFSDVREFGGIIDWTGDIEY